MRYFVLFLLALNILYFLLPKEDQAPARNFARGNPGIPLLVTLSEAGSAPSAQSAVPEAYTRPLGQQLASATQTRLDAVPLPDAAMTAGSDLDSPPPDAGSEEAGIHQLELETEADGTPVDHEALATTAPAKEADAAAKVADVAADQPPTDGLGCYSLGPFSDPERAQALVERLQKAGVTAPALRTEQQRRVRGYWVYLPSFPSRDAAMAVAEQLAQQGFRDYFVVSGGEHNNSVSLGLFTLKSGSESRVQLVRSMGFDPKVDVRSDESTLYWVDYQAKPDFNWQQYVEKKADAVPVDNQIRDCKPAAPIPAN